MYHRHDHLFCLMQELWNHLHNILLLAVSLFFTQNIYNPVRILILNLTPRSPQSVVWVISFVQLQTESVQLPREFLFL